MGMAMGNEFKAASGREVKPGEDGSVLFGAGLGYLSREAVFDAEEYFQAVRDAELGRWRWPLNPSFVCYEHDGGVFVLNEADGRSVLLRRGRVLPGLPLYSDAAVAYFEAHPERKPWHDAAEGEFWAVSHNRNFDVCRVNDARFISVMDVRKSGLLVSMPVTHHSIQHAERISIGRAS